MYFIFTTGLGLRLEITSIKTGGRILRGTQRSVRRKLKREGSGNVN